MTGKIKFVVRGGGIAASIPKTDLAAHEDGQNVPDPINTNRVQDLELPHEIDILYINPAFDYQQGIQVSTRQTGSGIGTTTVSLPIVMSDTKAKQVADVLHYNSWVERTTYKLSLSRKWSRLEPTDIIEVIYNNVSIIMRIVSKEETVSGIINLNCVSEDTTIYSQSGTGASTSNVYTQVIKVPVQTLMVYLDIAMLRDEDNTAGVYLAATGYRTGWDGCVLFKSVDNGITYSEVLSVTESSIVGNSTSALDNFYSGNIFDELNSFIVVLYDGTLSSATEAQVLSGVNTAVLGNEVIQFKNAELIATNTYKISGILRGRRGTEWAMSTHKIGDIFVLVSERTTRRLNIPTSEIGLSRKYKAVTMGTSIVNTQEKSLVATGAALECYSPIEPGVGRDTSNNLTISWKRRDRLNSGWRDYVDIPMSEASESYSIDIYTSNTFATVVRTLTSTSTSVSYTAAQQTTDFGTTITTVYAKVYQVSAVVGRGYPLTVSLYCPKP